jgi:hypothetical protein
VTPPRIVGVLPGAGFVLERVLEDGSKECLPLAGFGVTHDGDVVVLPTNLGPEWSCRAALPGDDATIRRTSARRMLRPSVGPFGYSLTPWLDDAT